MEFYHAREAKQMKGQANPLWMERRVWGLTVSLSQQRGIEPSGLSDDRVVLYIEQKWRDPECKAHMEPLSSRISTLYIFWAPQMESYCVAFPNTSKEEWLKLVTDEMMPSAFVQSPCEEMMTGVMRPFSTHTFAKVKSCYSGNLILSLLSNGAFFGLLCRWTLCIMRSDMGCRVEKGKHLRHIFCPSLFSVSGPLPPVLSLQVSWW
jgi:hypothetical protein